MAEARRRREAPGFEIWQVGRRIVSIDSPVRLQVLEALSKAPLTLGDLAAATGRAKATLSGLHLRELVDAGLVATAPDPHDSRVKWFRLAGHRLGSSSVSVPDLRQAVLGYVQASGYVPLRPLLDVLQPAMMVQHADQQYRDAVAQALGQLIGRMLTAKTPAQRRDELTQALAREGIGTVSWKNGKPQAAASTPEMARFIRMVAQSALAPAST